MSINEAITFAVILTRPDISSPTYLSACTNEKSKALHAIPVGDELVDHDCPVGQSCGDSMLESVEETHN